MAHEPFGVYERRAQPELVQRTVGDCCKNAAVLRHGLTCFTGADRDYFGKDATPASTIRPVWY